MPTASHQAILAFLYRLFHGHLEPQGGVAMFAPLRLRIRTGKFRDPDLLVLRDRDDERYQDRYWLGADLVGEVVSPDRPARDLVEKRRRLCRGGNPRVLDRRSPRRNGDGSRASGRANTGNAKGVSTGRIGGVVVVGRADCRSTRTPCSNQAYPDFTIALAGVRSRVVLADALAGHLGRCRPPANALR